MARSVLVGDAWLRATLALALVHGAFIGIVQVRPGLIAVVLWYVIPVLTALAAAMLLFVAFFRSWRHQAVPGRRQFAGYAALALVVGPWQRSERNRPPTMTGRAACGSGYRLMALSPLPGAVRRRR